MEDDIKVNNNDVLEDDLEFDDNDFDFVMEDTTSTKDRGIIEDVKTGVISGLKEKKEQTTDIAIDVVKESLPDEIKNTLNIFGSAKEYAEEKINKIKKNIGSDVADTSDKLANLTKDIPVLNNIFKSVSNYIRPDEGFSSNYNEETDSEKASRETNAILGATLKELISNKYTDNQKDIELTDINNKFLYNIGNTLENLLLFNTDITDRYYRKSLEVQFRQLYVLEKSHKLNLETSKEYLKYLEAIKHNVGLPDFVKLRTSEAFKSNVRNKFVNNLYDKFTNKGSIGDRIKRKVDGVVDTGMYAVQNMLSMIGMGGTAMDMAEGMGMSKGEISGSLASDEIVSTGKKIASKALNKILSKIPVVNKVTERIKKARLDPNKTIDKLRIKKDNMFANIVNNTLDYFKDEHLNKKTVEIGESMDLNSPDVFDRRVKLSIVRVIPELLSKILKEVSNISTKEYRDELSFDFEKNRFIKLNTVATRLENKIRKDVVDNKVVYRMRSLLDTIERKSGIKFNKKQRQELSEAFFNYGLNHNVGDIREFDESFYKGLNLDTAETYRTAISKIFDNDKMSENEKLDLAFEFKDKITDVAESIEVPTGMLEEFFESGKIRELIKKKWVKYNPHTGKYVFSNKKYMKFLTKEISRRAGEEDKFSWSNDRESDIEDNKDTFDIKKKAEEEFNKRTNNVRDFIYNKTDKSNRLKPTYIGNLENIKFLTEKEFKNKIIKDRVKYKVENIDKELKKIYDGVIDKLKEIKSPKDLKYVYDYLNKELRYLYNRFKNYKKLNNDINLQIVNKKIKDFKKSIFKDIKNVFGIYKSKIWKKEEEQKRRENKEDIKEQNKSFVDRFKNRAEEFITDTAKKAKIIKDTAIYTIEEKIKKEEKEKDKVKDNIDKTDLRDDTVTGVMRNANEKIFGKKTDVLDNDVLDNKDEIIKETVEEVFKKDEANRVKEKVKNDIEEEKNRLIIETLKNAAEFFEKQKEAKEELPKSKEEEKDAIERAKERKGSWLNRTKKKNPIERLIDKLDIYIDKKEKEVRAKDNNKKGIMGILGMLLGLGGGIFKLMTGSKSIFELISKTLTGSYKITKGVFGATKGIYKAAKGIFKGISAITGFFGINKAFKSFGNLLKWVFLGGKGNNGILTGIMSLPNALYKFTKGTKDIFVKGFDVLRHPLLNIEKLMVNATTALLSIVSFLPNLLSIKGLKETGGKLLDKVGIRKSKAGRNRGLWSKVKGLFTLKNIKKFGSKIGKIADRVISKVPIIKTPYKMAKTLFKIGSAGYKLFTGKIGLKEFAKKGGSAILDTAMSALDPLSLLAIGSYLMSKSKDENNDKQETSENIVREAKNTETVKKYSGKYNNETNFKETEYTELESDTGLIKTTPEEQVKINKKLKTRTDVNTIKSSVKFNVKETGIRLGYTDAKKQLKKNFPWLYSKLGCKYVFGAKPCDCCEYDCSSLVKSFYKRFGIELPRASFQQLESEHVKLIDFKDMKPGDILFWKTRDNGQKVSHVSIYVGDGWQVHARCRKCGVVLTNLFPSKKISKATLVAIGRVVKDPNEKVDEKQDGDTESKSVAKQEKENTKERATPVNPVEGGNDQKEDKGSPKVTKKKAEVSKEKTKNDLTKKKKIINRNSDLKSEIEKLLNEYDVIKTAYNMNEKEADKYKYNEKDSKELKKKKASKLSAYVGIPSQALLTLRNREEVLDKRVYKIVHDVLKKKLDYLEKIYKDYKNKAHINKLQVDRTLEDETEQEVIKKYKDKEVTVTEDTNVVDKDKSSSKQKVESKSKAKTKEDIKKLDKNVELKKIINKEPSLKKFFNIKDTYVENLKYNKDDSKEKQKDKFLKLDTITNIIGKAIDTINKYRKELGDDIVEKVLDKINNMNKKVEKYRNEYINNKSIDYGKITKKEKDNYDKNVNKELDKEVKNIDDVNGTSAKKATEKTEKQKKEDKVKLEKLIKKTKELEMKRHNLTYKMRKLKDNAKKLLGKDDEDSKKKLKTITKELEKLKKEYIDTTSSIRIYKEDIKKLDGKVPELPAKLKNKEPDISDIVTKEMIKRKVEEKKKEKSEKEKLDEAEKKANEKNKTGIDKKKYDGPLMSTLKTAAKGFMELIRELLGLPTEEDETKPDGTTPEKEDSTSGGTGEAIPRGSKKIDCADKLLLDRISIGEVGSTDEEKYDYVFGDGKYLKPPKPITQMTLGELKTFQNELVKATRHTKYPTSAVGRYQFVRKTLKEVQKQMKLSDSVKFTKETQDAMIIYRLIKFRKYDKWREGKITDDQFIHNLAGEFASIEDPKTHAGKGRLKDKHGNYQPIHTTIKDLYDTFRKMRECLKREGKITKYKEAASKTGNNTTGNSVKAKHDGGEVRTESKAKTKGQDIKKRHNSEHSESISNVTGTEVRNRHGGKVTGSVAKEKAKEVTEDKSESSEERRKRLNIKDNPRRNRKKYKKEQDTVLTNINKDNETKNDDAVVEIDETKETPVTINPRARRKSFRKNRTKVINQVSEANEVKKVKQINKIKSNNKNDNKVNVVSLEELAKKQEETNKTLNTIAINLDEQKNLTKDMVDTLKDKKKIAEEQLKVSKEHKDVTSQTKNEFKEIKSSIKVNNSGTPKKVDDIRKVNPYNNNTLVDVSRNSTR